MPFYKATGETIELGREIARGGQGVIFEAVEHPQFVAKIYNNPSQGFEQKLSWMKNNPPEDPTRSQGHASLAWPLELLYDEHAVFAGYLMPYIQNAVLSLEVYNPYLRALSFPDFNLKYLTRVARNLASALGAIHARGYVVGDLNESNVLITRSALVTLIDNDSFQVHEARQERIVVYPCPVGKPEFTPPELYGKSLAGELRRPEHDSFALAVLIFQLLMEGNHPFRSRWLGSDDPPSIEEKIYRGFYPYHKSLKNIVAPPPNAPPIGMLHPEAVELFTRCFVDGCQDSQKRPSPAEWEWALKTAEKSFIVCKNQHYFSDHLKACPECGSPRTTQPKSKSTKPAAGILPSPKEGFSKNQRQMDRTRWRFNFEQHQRERLLLWIAVFFVVLAFSFLVLNIPLINSVNSSGLTVTNRMPDGTDRLVNNQVASSTISPKSSYRGSPLPSAANPSAPVSPSLKPSPGATKTNAIKSSPSPGISALPTDTSNLTSPTPLKLKLKTKTPVPQNGSLIVANPDIKKSNPTTVNSWISPSPDHRITPENATELASIGKTINLAGAVLGLNYVHSNAIAATVLKDKTIKIWNPKDQSLRATLSGHSKAINTVAFSADGTMIASGSDDKTVMVWRTASGTLEQTLTGHTEMITCVAFSPDGRRLATGSADNNIIIWDLKDGSIVAKLIGHREDVTCIAFSPNGKILASGSNDKTIKLWNIEDATVLKTFDAHYRYISCLAFSPDGNKLISGAKDNTVRLWEMNGFTLSKTIKNQDAAPTCIQYSWDGAILAIGYRNGRVRIWNSDAQTLLSEVVSSPTPVVSLAFASNNSVLLAGSSDGDVTVLGIP